MTRDLKSILVAEDDQVTHAALVHIIESLDFVPISASNGKIAWSLIQENPQISLMIVDIMMEEIDGRELIKLVRGNSAYQDTPVIICSGIVQKEEVSDLLALGPSAFIAKPVKVSQLKAEIHRLLDSGERK